MNPVVNFRRCRLSDTTVLTELSRTTFYESFASQNTLENVQAYLSRAFSDQKLTEELSNEDSTFYFGYLEGKLIGYIKLNRGKAQTDIKDNSTMELERIYVRQGYQGQKLGQQFLDKAIDFARQQKAIYLWLGVWEKNTRAIRFYERNGFRKFGQHAFLMGKEKQTDLLMKLDLHHLAS